MIARQAIGAILNAECSFQRSEPSTEIQTVGTPPGGTYDGVADTSFSERLARCGSRSLPTTALRVRARGARRLDAGAGTVSPRDDTVAAALLDQCRLAYLSDDLATAGVRAADVEHGPRISSDDFSGVRLDHTVWFHRPVEAEQWHLSDVSCHHVADARGLAVGHVFDGGGRHTATYA